MGSTGRTNHFTLWPLDVILHHTHVGEPTQHRGMMVERLDEPERAMWEWSVLVAVTTWRPCSDSVRIPPIVQRKRSHSRSCACPGQDHTADRLEYIPAAFCDF